MATIFDATQYAPRERLPAFEALLSSSSCPVGIGDVGDMTNDRLLGWQIGESGLLMRLETNGMRMRRTSRHVRMAAPERVSFAVNLQGRCLAVNRDLSMTANHDVRMLDLTEPYENWMDGPTVTHALEVDCADLRMSPRDVHSAQAAITDSPLHGLAAMHLATLPTVLDEQESNPNASLLSALTLQLLRALVASVSTNDRISREAMHETQLDRVDTYIHQHLHEPDLTPARVAAAQYMSVRQLYNLFSDRGETPAAWILKQRLAAAREMLRRSHGEEVSAIARRCGFSDPSHFARRFRAEYGAAPREWTASHRSSVEPENAPAG